MRINMCVTYTCLSVLSFYLPICISLSASLSVSGVSRSVSMILMYLIAVHHVRLEAAWFHMHHIR